MTKIELEKCPVCKEMMQIVVDPEKVPKNPKNFIWTEHMIYKCYYCDHMQDFKGNVIQRETPNKANKKCPVCNTEMEIATFPVNVKSVWSGQKVFLCKRCGYSEDKHGNRIPRW